MRDANNKKMARLGPRGKGQERNGEKVQHPTTQTPISEPLPPTAQLKKQTGWAGGCRWCGEAGGVCVGS